MAEREGVSTLSTPVRRDARGFTPATARAALPLVRAIARDVHETYLRLRAQLAALDERRPLEQLSGDHTLPEELREELAELHSQIGELAEIGARLGDPERGIVLLDGVVDGEPGTICWKLGEDEIRFWYPLGARYEDRRPLPAP